MADPVTINGNQYDWGSIVVKIGGEVFHGFTAISWSEKRARTKSYGTGKHRAPRARTRGKYTLESVKLTGWKSSVAELLSQLAAGSPDGKSYGDSVFQVVVSYVESDETPITEEIVDCVVVGRDVSNDDNDDPLKEDLTIDAMYVKTNGLTLFDNSEGTR